MSGITFAHKLQNIIKNFEEFTTDGRLIRCTTCNQQYAFRQIRDVKRHINSQKHQENIRGEVNNDEFLYDLCSLLYTCGLSWKLVDNACFRKFCAKYMPDWSLPSSQTIRTRYLPKAYNNVMNSIREDVRNQYVWVTAEETVDFRNHKVINVLRRVLNVNHSVPPILIANKHVLQTTANSIEELVTDALRNVSVVNDNVLIFVTGAEVYMRKAAERLKLTYTKMIHVTCLVNTLHLVAFEIAKQYPMVDHLIWNTKKIFLDAGSLKTQFKKHLPDIPLPPSPIRTQQCTWLQSVGYFATYFEHIMEFILQLNPLESKAIRYSQNAFRAPNIHTDLNTIQQQFNCLIAATIKFAHPALSSEQALTIITDVQNTLMTLVDPKGVAVKKKLEAVLNRNTGYQTIRNIYTNRQNDNMSLNYFKYLRFAPLTSVDPEQSFSLHNHMHQPNRTNLSAVNSERILVTMMYAQAMQEYPCSGDMTCE